MKCGWQRASLEGEWLTDGAGRSTGGLEEFLKGKYEGLLRSNAREILNWIKNT